MSRKGTGWSLSNQNTTKKTLFCPTCRTRREQVGQNDYEYFGACSMKCEQAFLAYVTYNNNNAVGDKGLPLITPVYYRGEYNYSIWDPVKNRYVDIGALSVKTAIATSKYYNMQDWWK